MIIKKQTNIQIKLFIQIKKYYNMKKSIILTIAFISFVANVTFAQAGKYEKAMGQTMQKLSTAQSPEQFGEISNGFARIAAAEGNKWQAYYNAAYTQLISGFMSMQPDMVLAQSKVKQAMEYIEKMKTLELDNVAKSELNVLEAYCLVGKVSEDPMANGAKYTATIHELLDSALALNKNNARALYLKGMYLYNTPTFYGGGAGPAMPFLEGAQQLFLTTESTPLIINWGEEESANLLKQAKATK